MFMYRYWFLEHAKSFTEYVQFMHDSKKTTAAKRLKLLGDEKSQQCDLQFSGKYEADGDNYCNTNETSELFIKISIISTYFYIKTQYSTHTNAKTPFNIVSIGSKQQHKTAYSVIS